MIEIDQNGKKDFSSIQEALDSLAKTPYSGKEETLDSTGFSHGHRHDFILQLGPFSGGKDKQTVI